MNYNKYGNEMNCLKNFVRSSELHYANLWNSTMILVLNPMILSS